MPGMPVPGGLQALGGGSLRDEGREGDAVERLGLPGRLSQKVVPRLVVAFHSEINPAT
jgi:hypothetical protein